MPPMPRATSRASEPVGITETPWPAGCSPSRMMAPFPYCFSTWESVTSSIFSRSIPGTSSSHRAPPSGPVDRVRLAVLLRDGTLASGSDITYTPVIRDGNYGRLLEHVFEVNYPNDSGTRASGSYVAP